MKQLLKDQIAQSRNPSDWMWYKQLNPPICAKYFTDAKNRNQCMVGMCDAFFDYTFEYQGNAPKPYGQALRASWSTPPSPTSAT